MVLQYGDPNPPFQRKCALDIGEQRDNPPLPYYLPCISGNELSFPCTLQYRADVGR